MDIKELDLVMIRLPNRPGLRMRQPHFNTWFRVLFIDNDGTFIGRCELIDKPDFVLYEKNQEVRLKISKVQSIYQVGEQFCYGDGVTICACSGLCRNK